MGVIVQGAGGQVVNVEEREHRHPPISLSLLDSTGRSSRVKLTIYQARGVMNAIRTVLDGEWGEEECLLWLHKNCVRVCVSLVGVCSVPVEIQVTKKMDGLAQWVYAGRKDEPATLDDLRNVVHMAHAILRSGEACPLGDVCPIDGCSPVVKPESDEFCELCRSRCRGCCSYDRGGQCANYKPK